jgi:hypothetical protein
MNSNPLGYQTPEVTWRWDGVPLEVRQYDDRIAIHRPGRHRAGSVGSVSRCTNRGCHDTAVLDKLIANQYTGAWRAVCARHSLLLADRVSTSIKQFVLDMIDVALAEKVETARIEEARTHPERATPLR